MTWPNGAWMRNMITGPARIVTNHDGFTSQWKQQSQKGVVQECWFWSTRLPFFMRVGMTCPWEYKWLKGYIPETADFCKDFHKLKGRIADRSQPQLYSTSYYNDNVHFLTQDKYHRVVSNRFSRSPVDWLPYRFKRGHDGGQAAWRAYGVDWYVLLQ